MKNQLLAVSAKCGGNNRCLFEGHDLFLEISITNNHKTEIGFPLAFVQKTGPIIRLINNRTKAETYLRTNPADFDLQEKLVSIHPGGSVALEWVITSHEIQAFGTPPLDLSAEITVMAKILVDGNHAEFRGTDTLRIVSKDGS